MRVAIAFVSTQPPDLAQASIQSVRLHCSGATIYVAHRSENDEPMPAFYAESEVRPIRIPQELGIAAARNRLIAEVAEEYVWLVEDGVVFYGGTSCEGAVAILDARSDVAVVGGRLLGLDVDQDGVRSLHRESFLICDPARKLAISVPIYYLQPIVYEHNGVRSFICDSVLDFCLFRRSAFDADVRWDETLSETVSEDFFLNLKLNTKHGVAYLPEMVAFQRPVAGEWPEPAVFDPGGDGNDAFLRKWGLEQFGAIALGVLPDSEKLLPSANPDQRSGDSRAQVFAWPEIGKATQRLRLPRSTASNDMGRAVGQPSMRAAEQFDPTQWQILARYSPFCSPQTDFTLWCRGFAASGRSPGGVQQLALRARWFADDDRLLVWQSSRTLLQLADDGDWQQRVFRVPLLPPRAKFLRFEIAAEGIRGRSLLCRGFLLPTSTAPDDDSTLQVLALSVPYEAAASDQTAPLSVASDQVKGPAVSLAAGRLGPPEAGLLAVQVDPDLDARTLWLRSWPKVGKVPLAVVVPATDTGSPLVFAIPEPGPVDAAEMLLTTGSGRAAVVEFRPADVAGVAAPAPMPQPAVADKRTGLPLSAEVGVVVTSCGRQDLLEQTLDSFFAWNTAPIARFIIVEDGHGGANAPLMRKYRERQIDWLATEKHVGQIAAIDFAYQRLDTPFIFHLEDDWEFYRPGFIEKSMALLEELPDCLQVWIRALNDTNQHPLALERHELAGIPYRRLETGYQGIWHGFSFNPGLRRLADYRRLGMYRWFVTFDPHNPASSEWIISEIYRQLGFYAVILGDHNGTGYVRHIGWGRTVMKTTSAADGGS